MNKKIVLWLLCLVVSYATFAQSDLFTISEVNVPLKKIMQIIESKRKYTFTYQKEILQNPIKVTVHVKNRPIHEVMNQALKGLYLEYELIGDIVVLRTSKSAFQHAVTSIYVEGKVLNEEGFPLEGVSISVQNTNRGAYTDNNGRFKMPDLDPGAVLYFSYIGYQPAFVPIKDETQIELKLKASAIKNMDETIIIGYGKTTKRLNTGSVHKVSAAEITRQPVSNPLAAMQGSVPGLLVTQSNGLPGTAFKVQLRGQSSIGITPGKLQPNDPFFIIDGVPFGPNNSPILSVTSGTAFGSEGRSPFSVINPSDIESIEVLKDADATAIYGSRGANGVVLITTKKGKPGKPVTNVGIYTGVSHITRHLNTLNTRQYVQMRSKAFENDGLTPNNNNAYDLLLWDTTRYTNFKDLLIGNTANVTNVQLSLSGGTDRLHYLIGTGYNHETTVFPGNFSDNRASLHMHLKHQSVDNKFTAGLSLLYANDKNNSIIKDLTDLIFSPPNTPSLYDSAGNLNFQQGGRSFVNPMSYVKQPYESRTGNLLTGLDLNYRVNKKLVIKANVGYNRLTADELTLIPRSSQNFTANPTIQGRSFFGNTLYESQIVEPQVEYTTYIKNSKLAVLVGSTYQRSFNRVTSVTATGFNDDAFLRHAHEAENLDSTENKFEYRYAAVFARLHYMLHNTYIINLTARRDGSSRFGPSKQFGNFGAAGAAWIFSNESFIKRTLPFLSFGKLRGSYGITGNDRIGDYKYLDRWRIAPNNYLGNAGIIPIQLADSSYSWEVSRKLEAAIELGLLKDRVQFSVTWYRNRNGNQLIVYPLPAITGFSKYEAKNSGALVQNTGFEIMLRMQNKPGKRLGWMNSVTLTIPRNKLLSFPSLESSAYTNLITGQSLSVIQLFHYTGLDAGNGLFGFEDVDGDGVISAPKDYRIVDNRDPKWYAGMQNSIHYKNWQLDVFWEIRKQKAYDYLYSVYLLLGQPGKLTVNQPANVFEKTYQSFSTGANSNASAAADNFFKSDGVFSDASYMRVKNVALWWSLPVRWQEKLSLKNCRIYMKAQNLFTFTQFYGADPETQSIKTLPPLRIITGGVELSF